MCTFSTKSVKNLKAFTVSRASNDPQQLSLAQLASLQLNPVVHVTITQREGVFLSDVQHVHLYSLFN